MVGAASAAKLLVARNVARGTVLATRLESASGLWARGMGLMGRASLDPDGGLWIAGTNGIHMMFMRFPIDAVFLGKPTAEDAAVRQVVAVHGDLRAWTGLVPFVRGAHGVLELPVGTIEASGTQAGDLVRLG